MAPFDKRQAGCSVSWLSAISNSALGTFCAPQAETPKALKTLRALLDPAKVMFFRDHRKFSGLLEHTVGAIHACRLVMYSLYEPYRRLRGDPEGRVHLSDFGRCQAGARVIALLTMPGRHCSATSAPTPPAPAPHNPGALSQRFIIYTDAAGGWNRVSFSPSPFPSRILSSSPSF
jgi:hypothetical protein